MQLVLEHRLYELMMTEDVGVVNNGRRFADEIFKSIFWNENGCIRDLNYTEVCSPASINDKPVWFR